MNIKKILSIIFLICGLISCQAKRDNSNVELTDFTKDLITLYINDAVNINAKNRNDEIIVTAFADTSYYHLSVFANNHKKYKFCREDFIGQTLYLGHLVRIFGDENSMFYSLNKKIKKQKRCKDNYAEYDPNVWQICFYKDKSFDKMRTYKGAPSEDISEIQVLAGKYFKISETIKDEVFQLGEVENEPNFVLGEDSLRRIISSNFKIRKDGNFGKIPLVVHIVVDKKGKAMLKGLVKSSNDIELNNEAKRVAELICLSDFIPASHRGETVKAIYPIVFLRSDVTPARADIYPRAGRQSRKKHETAGTVAE